MAFSWAEQGSCSSPECRGTGERDSPLQEAWAFGESGSALLLGISGRSSQPKAHFLEPLSHTLEFTVVFSLLLGSELNCGLATLRFTSQTELLLSLLLGSDSGQEFRKCIDTKSFLLGALPHQEQSQLFLRDPRPGTHLH